MKDKKSISYNENFLDHTCILCRIIIDHILENDLPAEDVPLELMKAVISFESKLLLSGMETTDTKSLNKNIKLLHLWNESRYENLKKFISNWEKSKINELNSEVKTK